MIYFLRASIFIFLIGFTPWAHAETNVYFSPNGGCQEEVIKEINKARQTIDVAMYEFTSKEIAQALIEARHRHVKIRVTLDTSQIKDHFSKSRYLIAKGLDLKFHMGPGLLHDKFAVIDDRVVMTGSYNWTVMAEKRNFENLLLITDKEIVQKYSKEFKHLWGQSGEGQLKELQPAEK